MNDRWSPLYPQDVDDIKRGRIGQPQPREVKPLNVVIPTWKGDQDQAIRLLEWIGELGFVQAPFWLACSRECQVQRMMDLARKAFSVVNWIEDGERLVSNWNEAGDHPKSAAGPNSLYRQVAWTFGLQKKGPWLFLEPDAVPCKRDWYDLLNREYQICGKPFMGFLVEPKNHPGVPNHMSGVGIYPEDMISRSQAAIEPSETAFDIAGREDILPNAHFTSLIKHHYRAPAFKTQEEFESRVDGKIAVYHANKDGSIYPYLRKRLGLQGGDVPCVHHDQQSVLSTDGLTPSRSVHIVPVSSNGAESSTTLHAPTVDIFIKTREHDRPWLEWCAKSIAKFQSGFRNLIILGDNESTPHFDYTTDNHISKWDTPKEPGYLWQQVCKLNADKHVDADWILYMDSDCVFTREVTPSDFIKDDKPIWLYTPWGDAREDQKIWGPVMENFLGKPSPNEFMRRHPFCVPRWALERFREFCLIKHGKTIEDYIMGQAVPGSPTALVFSEWNCLGFFLWEYHRDKVEWVLDSDAGPACVYQGHTHDGEKRMHQDLAKFREILDGSTPLVGHNAPEETHLTPPVLTEDQAIEALLARMSDSKSKAKILAELTKRSPKFKGAHFKKKKAKA